MEKGNSNRGITLIALVITIIVLLILAGISIAMLTGENGILTKADRSREETEKQSIIEEARIEILEKQTENFGTLTEKELINILTPSYGTLSNNGEKTVLDKILITKDGKYKIPVKEIYTGLLKKEKGKCTVSGALEINFTEGDTWNNFSDQLIKWWDIYGDITTREGVILMKSGVEVFSLKLITEDGTYEEVHWEDELINEGEYAPMP